MRKLVPIALVFSATVVAVIWASTDPAPDMQAPKAAPRPSLTVTVTLPRADRLPVRLAATGDVVAWQEAIVGAEANGLRLSGVFANVGDQVRRGALLATFTPETAIAELEQSRAAVAEAAATFADASANAQRARTLEATGALSAQQVQQRLTAERTSKAKMDAAQAVSRLQEIRLAQTRVHAPDDGVVSMRSATVGAVMSAGQEMFRIIRQGRLEWHAEIPAADLPRVRPGQRVIVQSEGSEPVAGQVRVLAPSVNTQTRSGLGIVDLPSDHGLRAGTFARGEIEIGEGAPTLTLPQTAVVQRDGFDYVMRLGAEGRVMQTKVTLGRAAGHRVEILTGIDASSQVVATGASFLSDGDSVRVVAEPYAQSKPPPSTSRAGK
jgi:HlyD family secretion protein